VNELLFALGLESWKPVLTALVLPPLPLFLIVLVGTRMRFKRPLTGWAVVLLGLASLWLSTTPAVGGWLTRVLLHPPAAMQPEAITALRHSPKSAIVVLGAGRRVLAPEYGVATLKAMSIERLRYGIWLSRETGLPLAFSGGVGHGALAGPSEAESAARIAEREFGRPLRWQEGMSRDTHENAVKSIALLKPQGIETIVLVTHGYHMRRALAQFETAAEGTGIRIVPAAMGLAPRGSLRAADWLPSPDGYDQVCLALHEWLGRLAGA
jgi:uncharacterized SAM-binding protein YcdF (DUF218 family)